MMKHKIWIVLLLLLNNSSLLFSQHCRIGDIITNPDGSRGVVFYLNPDRLGGWMVALNDQSSGCKWGANGDIPDLQNYTSQNTDPLLMDLDGKENTRIIRAYQNNNTTYAAGKVDFEHGWYLPSIGQLRILFGTMALIEPSLIAYGGSRLGDGMYWSSTEQDATLAKTLSAENGARFHLLGKNYDAAVRAIHDFSFFEWSDGSIADHIEVTPTETTPYTVTVQTGICGAAETSIEVRVSPVPLDLSILPAGPLSICEGNMLQLQAQTSNLGDWVCEWSDLSTGQSFAETGTTLQVAADDLGIGQHEIQVIMSAANNENCSESATIEVMVYAMPTADAGSDQTIPYGSQATLTAVDAGTGASYSWTPTNKIQGDPNQQTVTTTNLTTDQPYTLTVTLNGCTSTDEVTVHILTPLNASAMAEPDIICPGETATLTASATGGTGNYSYSWSPAEYIATGLHSATATTIGLEETRTFTCTVTDGNQTLTPTATVSVRVLPTASATADATVLCSGSSTMLHAATAAGASYEWAPPDKIQGNPNQKDVTTIPLTETTTFTLTVTRHGCENTDEVTVTVNQYPDAYAGEDQTIPYNTSTTLTAADAGPGAYYSWSPANMIQGPANQPQITTKNLQEDQTYELTVTRNGCESYSEATVYVGGALHASATAQLESVCPEGTTTLTVTATEGTGNYTYSWAPPDLIASGGNSAIATTTGLTETTTFTCTVSDGNQTLYPEVTVTVKPLPDATATADETTLCSGESTLLHAATVAGASYEWSPANKIQGNADQPNVTTTALSETTTFLLTVRLNGCENTDEVTVTVNEYPTADAGPDQNIPYNSQTTLTAADAGAGATYLWSPDTMIQGPANQRIVTTTNLSIDQVYTLTVTRNDCESTDQMAVHVGEPLTATVAANATSVCPDETTTLTATVANGTGNYSYSWAPPDLIASGGNSAIATTTGLMETTTFTCTVSDGNQTLYPEVTVTVKPLPEATATADETTLCSGESTLLHAATVAGASYEWSPANKIQGNAEQPNVTTTALSETTTFLLTVRLNGCENTDEVTVTVNEYPTANAGPDQNIPFDSQATLTALDAGGGAFYQWLPEDKIQTGQGTTTAITESLSETTVFTLAVTLNGCTSSDEVTVVVGDQLYASASAEPEAVCPGQTATLTATASSGTGNYSYSWEPAELIDGDNTLPTVTTIGLETEQTFTVTVDDGNETLTSSVTVTVFPSVEAAIEGDDAVCLDTPLTLTAYPDGMSYLWSTGETSQSITITEPVAGTYDYTVTVISSNGCEGQAIHTLLVHPLPIADASGSDQQVGFGASATLVALDAGGGAFYQWLPEDKIQTGQGTAIATTEGLSETTVFTLAVTLNGCTSSDEVTVVVGDQLYASASAEPEAVCPGQTATLTATASSGTGNYSYSWEPAELIDGDNTLPTVTTIGLETEQTFTVTVDDGNETLTSSVTVTVFPSVEAAIEGDDAVCLDTPLTLTAYPDGMSYLWSTGETSQSITVTEPVAGTYDYTVTVTSPDICEDEATFSLTVHPLPTAYAGEDFIIPYDSPATLAASDAGEGAAYLWEPEELIATGQGTATVTTVALTEEQTFTLTVTLNDCQTSDQVTVYVGEGLLASASADPQAVCQGETSTLTVNALGGSGEYSYSWDPAELIDGDNTLQTVTTIGLETEQTFTVTVDDGNETLTSSVTVTVFPSVEATIEGDDAVCLDTPLTLTAYPDGMSYLWSTGETSQSITVTEPVAGTYDYTVTVTSPDICEDEATFSLTVHPLPTAYAGEDFIIPYDSPATLAASDAGEGAAYLWEPEELIATGQGMAMATTVALTEEQTFTLTVTLNDCQTSDQVTVYVGEGLVASASADPQAVCQGGTSTLTVNALGGSGEYSYFWEPADFIDGDNTLQIVTTIGLETEQTFTVTVDDGNETLTSSVTVTVFPSVEATIEGDDAVCLDTPLTLTAYPDGMSYLWSTGETSQSITVTEPVAGTYDYTVTVTSPDSCEDEATFSLTVHPLPTAYAGEDFIIPYDSPAILAASDAGEGAAYLWEPEELIATGQGTATATTVALTEEQTFTLTVTLNDCQTSDQVTVYVGEGLVASASADPQAVCQGGTSTLTVNALGGSGEYSYSWEPADFIDGDNTLQIVTTIGLETEQTFTVTVDDGNETVSPTVTVTVYPLPTADASGSDHQVSYDASATLVAADAGIGAEYYWLPEELIQTGQGTTTATTIGLTEQTTFTLKVTSNDCEATDEVTVTVDDQLNAIASADPEEICLGRTATLTVEALGGAGNYTYQWEPADLIDGDNTLQTVTTTGLEAEQTFTVTVTDEAGANLTAQATVAVIPPPMQGDTTAVVHHPILWYGQIYNTTGSYPHTIPDGSYLGCDSTVVLHLTVLPAPIGDTTAFSCGPFQWYGQNLTQSGHYSHTFHGGGYLDSDSTVLLHLTVEYPVNDTIEVITCEQYQWQGQTLTQPGFYTETLTSLNGCDSTVTINLQINHPDLQILGYKDVFYASDIWHGIYHYYLTDSTYTYLGTVEWECSNPDWVVLPMSDFHCVIIVRTMGMGILTAHPTNLLGCDDQLSIEIHATEFNNHVDDEIPVLVYPNPADRDVIVMASNLLNVKVFNVLGQHIMTVPPEHNDTTTVPIGSLAGGLYLLEIATSYGVYMEPLIVRK